MQNPKIKTQSIKSDDFKSVARDHECDESEASFDKALKKIAKAKPDTKGTKQ